MTTISHYPHDLNTKYYAVLLNTIYLLFVEGTNILKHL